MSLPSGNRSNSQIVYVYDLPYTERKSLCNILDMNEQWERLGGEMMGFSVIDLNEIKRAEKCGESPTDRLLQLWGRKNNTVLNLYLLLYDIEHFQAMNILKPFISEEYHVEKIKDEFSYGEPKDINSLNSYIRPDEKITVKRPPAALLIDLKSEAAAFELGRQLDTVQAVTQEQNKVQNHNINPGPSRPSAIFSDFANKKVPDHFLCTPVFEKKVDNTFDPKDKLNLPNSNSIDKNQNLKCDKIVNSVNNFYEDLDNGNVKPLMDLNTAPLKAACMVNSHSDSSYLINNLIDSSNNMKSPVESQRRQQSMISNISNLSECGVPMIPYDELEEATGNWSKHHFLGNGGFGSVYKGTWINVQVAIKRINQNTQNDSTQNITQTLDELKYLLKFRHDNILQVYGFSAEEGKPLCLVYQFMPNGSLEYRLQCKKIEGFGEKAPKPLTWYERFFVAKGTAAALEFLHTVQDKPLIHGDVKSANILLDKNLEPKLGDFGLAREGPQSQYTSMQVSHVHGTRPYIPEEYLRSKKLSTKVDTYSYGIVLFEICTGCKAYNEKSKKYLKDQILEEKDHHYSLKDSKGGPDNANIFEILFDIGIECINKFHKKRPDMASTFQKLKSCAKAVSKDDHKYRADECPLGSPSVSPLPIQTWQDTFASYSTFPSTYQSAALFLHPSRIPTSHRHQLNQISVSVPPNTLPYGSYRGFSPLPNPPPSPVPHMISGMRMNIAHGWVKGSGGSNIHRFSPSIHLPSGIDQMRNNSAVSKLDETSFEKESIISEEVGVIPIPDFSRIMRNSPNSNFETSEHINSESSYSEIEESNFSQKSTSHHVAKDGSTILSSNLLKSYECKADLKSYTNCSNPSEAPKLESSKPSSVGKKSLLD